jgi:hypothetical protein
MGACVFCRRADRPLTREHVFAHWLVLKVHGGRLVASRGRAPSSTRPERIARLVAGVCADCNAGWMSSLEVSFRRAVFARPRVGIVPAPDRVTVSRWFTKTAVLLAHADGGALGDAERHPTLAAGMPDDIEVFLARRRRPPQRLDFTVDLMTDHERDAKRARSVTIFLDDLVGHVAVRGTLAGRHGTRLWPLRTHALRWETLPVIGVVAS